MNRAVTTLVVGLSQLLCAVACAEQPKEVQLHEVNSLKEFQKEFNQDKGKKRLLVLLSPTCPMCVNGAKWIEEEVLAKYPDEEIEVYAVWFKMIPTDRKSRWKEELLNDERTTHYWDEGRKLGRWISENVEGCHHLGAVDWDAYYLFDEDAEWNDTLGPIEACGSPILRAKESLIRTAEVLFTDDDSPDGEE